MSFQFPEIEQVDPSVLASISASDAFKQSLQEYVTASIGPAVEARVEVIKSDFKQKMDALDAKRQAAEERAQAADIDPEELQALREARAKNPELQATLDAMKQKEAERQAELEKLQKKTEQLRLNTSVNQAIAAYNTEHTTRALKPDAADLVTLLARDALQFDPEKDEFRVLTPSGEPMATDKGAATLVDWLVHVRSERPSMFEQPTGGGAPGGGDSGSADKTMTRDQFARLAPAEAAKAVQTHTIVD